MISNLYKIGEEIVFYSPSLNSRRTELYQGLLDGSLIGYDSLNNVMSATQAVDGLCTICDRFTGSNNLDKIYANISLAPTIIAVVRNELISYPQGMALIGKLADVIPMLYVGMFNTASETILQITPDEIITIERLNKWSSMLVSADAIK